MHLHPRRPADGIDLGGAVNRFAAIRAWRRPPDIVSLNVSEDDFPDLGAALAQGIGIEAGVFTVADADALRAAPWVRAVTRVLVEVDPEAEPEAVAVARAIDESVLALGRPRLWHGDNRTTWAVVDAGLAAGVDVRVGLEDTLIGRDGDAAPANAVQVALTAAARRR